MVELLEEDDEEDVEEDEELEDLEPEENRLLLPRNPVEADVEEVPEPVLWTVGPLEVLVEESDDVLVVVADGDDVLLEFVRPAVL